MDPHIAGVPVAEKSMGVDQVQGGLFRHRQKACAGLVNSDAYDLSWPGVEVEEPESCCRLYYLAHSTGVAVFPITFHTAIIVNSNGNIHFIIFLRKI